jgi:hypothetical protein
VSSAAGLKRGLPFSENTTFTMLGPLGFDFKEDVMVEDFGLILLIS